MEEIDGIIFLTLKGIGCEFSENETALDNIVPETFIKAVIMCLRKIQPSTNLSLTIPRSMSARYQYGITVAEACKKVGYKEDIGYQTILYGNIIDMRRILMFLIEKLPKETEKLSKDYKNKRFTILKTLKENLSFNRKEFNSSLFANYLFLSVPLETGVTLPGYKRNCSPAEWRRFCMNELKYITEQPSDLKYLIPSLITLNTNRLLNVYEQKNINTDDLSQLNLLKKNINTTNVQNKNKLNIIENKLSTTNCDEKSSVKETKSICIENLISQNNQLKNSISVENISKSNLISKLEKIEKESTVQEKSLNIIDNPEIIAKLKYKINALPDKMKKMKNKWSNYESEQKLILSELNQEINKKQANNNNLKTVYDNEKFKLQKIFEEIKKKEEIIQICRNDLESKSNYNSRSSYTHRILEIISNIEKQKVEINKNLKDTRLVQKEINSLDGKLERCFILIDELMFKVAKKDEIIRKCYKLLVAIHTNSSSIIGSVKQTGTIGREIKDLEEQIENENSRHATANVEKLKNDLDLVQNEQVLLLKKIENLKKSDKF